MNPMTLEAARLIVRAPAPTLGELSVALAVLKDSPHEYDRVIAREWQGLRCGPDPIRQQGETA